MRTLLALILLSMPALAADRFWEAAAVKAACGSDSVKFNVTSNVPQPLAQPDAGKALVYVVEQFDGPVNELVTPTVRVGFDGAWVGANYGTSYLFFTVDPGAHHLCSDWQSFPPLVPHIQPSLVSLTAETGQTYYFRAHIVLHSGNGPWTLDLERLDSDEGQLLVDTSQPSGYKQKK